MNFIKLNIAILLVLSTAACALPSSGVSKWHTEGPPNQQVQVREVESMGGVESAGANIGIADSVITSFATSGPSERRAPLKALPAPAIRLSGAQVTYLNSEISKTLGIARSINADVARIGSAAWLSIKEKYPQLTHVAITLFDVSETYKISQEPHHLPYMWSSSIVARTVLVDLNTRLVVAEWRQEVADRSTWTDACSSPEELSRYLAPVEGTPGTRK